MGKALNGWTGLDWILTRAPCDIDVVAGDDSVADNGDDNVDGLHQVN